MSKLQEQGYVCVWGDGAGDERGLGEIFLDRYGIGVGSWEQDAECSTEDGATEYAGLCPGAKAVVVRETSDGQSIWEKSTELGSKCIVRNCPNHQAEGRFVGTLCAPCHRFITDGTGANSQAYRNTLLFAEELVGNLILQQEARDGMLDQLHEAELTLTLLRPRAYAALRRLEAEASLRGARESERVVRAEVLDADETTTAYRAAVLRAERLWRQAHGMPEARVKG